MSSDRKSRIPVGSQFSPELIHLPSFVAMAVDHSGDIAALEKAVVRSPVRRQPYRKVPTARQARLPLEAAVQYGLLEAGTLRATKLASDLAALSENDAHARFARHILTNCGGLRVVAAVKQMSLEHRQLSGDSIAQHLTEQGFRVTVHNTAINTLRMWLAQAGVFPGDRRNAWTPDDKVVQQLVGLAPSQVDALTHLSAEQRSFVLALARLDPSPETDLVAAEIRDMAEAAAGTSIGRSSLPNDILRPLEAAGLITFTTKGTGGGKSSTLRVSPTFRGEVVEPFLSVTVKDLDPVTTAFFKESPEAIRTKLKSTSATERGQALEAYAVLVMRLLGLRLVAWRRRAVETGNSEVDVLMEGLVGVLPTTWQVQCKNTPQSPVRLEDVAREVGLLPLTHATHILIVANSSFTSDAKRFAEEIMLSSPATVFLLDREAFELMLLKPSSLADIIRRQAEHVRQLKASRPFWGSR